MKAFTAVIALSGLATSALAIDFSVFPECAVPCIKDAIPKAGCADPNDVKCFCDPETIKKLAPSAAACLMDKCPMDALGKVQEAAGKVCAATGNTVTVPSDSSTAAVTTAASSSPVPESSGPAVVSSSQAAVSSSVPAVSSSAAAPTITTTTGAAQPTGSVTASTTQPPITAGANAGPMVGAAAAVLAAAMAF